MQLNESLRREGVTDGKVEVPGDYSFRMEQLESLNSTLTAELDHCYRNQLEFIAAARAFGSEVKEDGNDAAHAALSWKLLAMLSLLSETV